MPLRTSSSRSIASLMATRTSRRRRTGLRTLKTRPDVVGPQQRVWAYVAAGVDELDRVATHLVEEVDLAPHHPRPRRSMGRVISDLYSLQIRRALIYEAFASSATGFGTHELDGPVRSPRPSLSPLSTIRLLKSSIFTDEGFCSVSARWRSSSAVTEAISGASRPSFFPSRVAYRGAVSASPCGTSNVSPASRSSAGGYPIR